MYGARQTVGGMGRILSERMTALIRQVAQSRRRALPCQRAETSSGFHEAIYQSRANCRALDCDIRSAHWQHSTHIARSRWLCIPDLGEIEMPPSLFSTSNRTRESCCGSLGDLLTAVESADPIPAELVGVPVQRSEESSHCWCVYGSTEVAEVSVLRAVTCAGGPAPRP
ncbi:hypothetical protein BT67DRAFT_69775 [Trichocladium antarcticum]|uniref:Uncharacterized protein n=1 Tax=Trichocladium antarcticum TaxID=1450529 RepID=A0AAN6ZCN0_9PEZI|nr:hypothetical protein BT67DRAFT_69775 [Trichocladium antarcticum]